MAQSLKVHRFPTVARTSCSMSKVLIGFRLSCTRERKAGQVSNSTVRTTSGSRRRKKSDSISPANRSLRPFHEAPRDLKCPPFASSEEPTVRSSNLRLSMYHSPARCCERAAVRQSERQSRSGTPKVASRGTSSAASQWNLSAAPHIVRSPGVEIPAKAGRPDRALNRRLPQAHRRASHALFSWQSQSPRQPQRAVRRGEQKTESR